MLKYGSITFSGGPRGGQRRRTFRRRTCFGVDGLDGVGEEAVGVSEGDEGDAAMLGGWSSS